MDPVRAQLVIGPRQAGKSTAIWRHLQRADTPALYLNCEDPSISGWLQSPALFLADLEELEIGAIPLFFEEVQALEDAGLFLKGLVDRRTGRSIFATGSSAFDLEAQTRESLAGRAHRHLLLPLSLAELPLPPGGPLPGGPLDRLRRAEQVPRAAVLGGYPSVWGAESPESELADLAEAFVLRDVSDRFRIRHLSAFRKIVQLAASQIGNLINFSEWASLAAVSHQTATDYAQLLEEAHIIRLIRPFIGGKRAEITQAPKVYFIDNGLRNQIFGGFQAFADRADRGALMENLVFTELAKSLNPLLDSIRFWRTKSGAEIDFVVEHQGRRLAVEVKAGNPRGKITRGQRSFIEAYAPELLLIVGAGGQEARHLDATRIEFIEPVDVARRVLEWRASRP
ncbi:MAG: ATP-binding protein [Acidobacteriota bacterium]